MHGHRPLHALVGDVLDLQCSLHRPARVRGCHHVKLCLHAAMLWDAEPARDTNLPDNRRMLLAVDVGNTQTHIGAFDGEELVRDWRLGTVPSATADELAATISHLLALDDLSFGSLDGAIVSTVVPQLGPE